MPTKPTVKAIRELVRTEGGKNHETVAHADREATMKLPSKRSQKLVPTAVALCNCGLPMTVSIPIHARNGGRRDPERVCIVCDSLASWPRYNGTEVAEP